MISYYAGGERKKSGAYNSQTQQLQARSEKKEGTKSTLEEYLIGPELANLAALRALETGTLSSGSPRRSETSRSQTLSMEIMNSHPVTITEKRRKSKEIIEKDRRSKERIRERSDRKSKENPKSVEVNTPNRASKDILASGSQPATPKQPLIRSVQQTITSSGGSHSAGRDGSIRTRSGRTPAERLALLENSSPSIPEGKSEKSPIVQPAASVMYENPAQDLVPHTPENVPPTQVIDSASSPAMDLSAANLALKTNQDEVGLSWL